MISEAILIPKIYARLQEIASNFSKFSGEAPQTHRRRSRLRRSVRGFALLSDPPFPKFLDRRFLRIYSIKMSTLLSSIGGNYRGIRLSSILAKTYNRMILSRIRPEIDRINHAEWVPAGQNNYQPDPSSQKDH